MTTIADIYKQAEDLINRLISKTAINKGHHLTGALEDSLDAEVFKKGNAEVMEGFALAYAQYLNDGTRPEKASMKQFPFLREYFVKRGLPDVEGNRQASAAAAATIRVWMKEGMSTKASSRFSDDGTRNSIITDAFENDNGQINNLINSGINKVVEEDFQTEKSEII